jgi:hypothetical protein
MDNITEQLKQMETDRKKLVERVNSTSGFEHTEAVTALKAHDIAAGKLLLGDGQWTKKFIPRS